MESLDVVAIVSVGEASRDQKIAFMGAMLDRQWRAIPECANGYFAAFPRDTGETQAVAQSEYEIGECAQLSGIQEWDAVCLLQD